ncbi:MAG TPA: alpha/beta fold hydrolase, partial [Gammaproteobacteria bacterium]
MRDRPTDPPPTTPYDVVLETGLLRLRHYRPETPRAGSAPVLLIHSLLKRPYILDLVPERSVVRSVLRQGSPVYLTDWLPPSDRDAGRGLQDYVESDLASAVDGIMRIERVDGVALVGCCLGGFLAALYAALHPQDAKALAVLALPFQSRPPFVPAVAEYLARLYGNVPASWLRAALNARVADPASVPGFLAAELGEPELASPSASADALALRRAFATWLTSDVPFAGRLFSDVMGDAYGR